MNLQDLLIEADTLRFRSETQQAIPLYTQVADLAQKQSDFKLAGHALHMIGVCYKMDNQTEEAIDALTNASNYYNEHGYPEKEGVVLCDIGSVYEYAGDLANARKHLQDAITKLTNTADRGAHGIALARLGHLKIKQNDEGALADLTQAIKILRTADAWFFLASAVGYLGEYHATQSDYADAIIQLEESLHIYNSHPEENHPRRLAQCHGGLAYCNAYLGNKEAARTHLRLALNIILSDEVTLSATNVLLNDIRAEETLNLLASQ